MENNQLDYMSEVKLIDKNGKYFEVEFGYSYLKSNKESYFSVTTQNGQDMFVPDGEAQEQLLGLWQKYHLTPINKGLETITTIILDELQQSLEDEWVTRASVANMPVDYLKEIINSECLGVRGEYEYHAIALAKHCECTIDEMKNIKQESGKYANLNMFTCQGRNYLVATDDEADVLEREYVENVIDECYLAEFISEEQKSRRSNPLLTYLDKDKWIDDWCGNRGENLSSQDGIEHEIKIVNEWFFIYEQ